MSLLTRVKKSLRHRVAHQASQPLSKLLSLTGFGRYGPGPQLKSPEPLRQAGIPYETFRFDVAGLERFWNELQAGSAVLRHYCAVQPYWEKRSQYHYSWTQLAPLLAREDAVYVDIASTLNSPYLEVIRALAKTRNVFVQDLVFPPGINGHEIGGSAAELPLGNASVDAMTLHCSFEHFEGGADTGFIREAARVLRPGGRVCIVPLYLGEYAFTMCDPAWGHDIRREAEPVIHLFPGWGERHGRFYGVDTLKQRVLEPAHAAGLKSRIIHFENILELHPTCYTHFGLVLEKPAVG
ncbi:class I SAM-dependent methyltransferase [Myxococcus qinghaiensis]|uniref:class I SAM-dependent methyltransferase n=1 Tax=Myxococcus qinghaiensis TaxID=2906758 RepID=UPI0020A82D0B|nr:class I SAM-dependent methyltransferase [Myxococcus qinghaiensis]MCP3166715.1 class I SAM-dependent methyltransferase [Myxococcus qinghaiensis]